MPNLLRATVLLPPFPLPVHTSDNEALRAPAASLPACLEAPVELAFRKLDTQRAEGWRKALEEATVGGYDVA